jgi:uncharacterized membrane protein YbjE (DUF340 family)
MIAVAAVMFAGILAGYLLREKNKIVRMNNRLTMWVIYLLLLFLGLAIGNNDYIMQHLHDLGFQALLITLAAITGSLLSAWILWKLVFSKKERSIER